MRKRCHIHSPHHCTSPIKRLMEPISSLVQFMCKSLLSFVSGAKQQSHKTPALLMLNIISRNMIGIVKLRQISMLSATSRLECGVDDTCNHHAWRAKAGKKSIHVEVVVSYRWFFFHFFFVLPATWKEEKKKLGKRAFSFFHTWTNVLDASSFWRMPWPMVSIFSSLFAQPRDGWRVTADHWRNFSIVSLCIPSFHSVNQFCRSMRE